MPAVTSEERPPRVGANLSLAPRVAAGLGVKPWAGWRGLQLRSHGQAPTDAPRAVKIGDRAHG